VSSNNGLLKPWPSIIERAILPASYPKCQWSRCGSSCSGSRKTMTTSRMASATRTITARNRGKRSEPGTCLEICCETCDGVSAPAFGLEETDKAELFCLALDHKAGPSNLKIISQNGRTDTDYVAQSPSRVARPYPGAHSPHDGQVVVQVVDRIQNLRQQFVRSIKVAQVRP